MINEGLQRTLVVGLGEASARVVDRVLAHLLGTLGPVGIVEGIGVRAAEGEEANLALVEAILPVSPEAPFVEWQTNLEVVVAARLRRISRLEHLTRLAGQGLTLRHADEVHLILAADLSRPWVARWLAAIASSLHEVVYRTLRCDSALTGLLLSPETGDQTGAENKGRPGPPPSNLPAFQSSPLPSPHPPASIDIPEDFIPERLDLFNRGCFVAGLTNESGLVVGEANDLIERAAHFLALLVTSSLGSTATHLEDPAIWEGMSLASFGLATVRWPGPELVTTLSQRWAETALARLMAPAPGVHQEANVAVQRLVAAERLSPPLLVERLAELMPDLPYHLADEVPDPPWPWQLVGVQKRLETVARNWEAAWLAARGTLKPTLAEVAEVARAAASTWLVQEIAGVEEGALTVAKACLSAMERLLEAFAEGVEAEVEEVEADLVAVERRLRATAASLDSRVATFPLSPVDALLRWGLRPMQWLRRWAECRQAQAAARQYAHLLRARFTALQAVWLYEAALPFYREWLTAWKKEFKAWEGCARQVSQARELPALRNWQKQVEEALAAAAGPWTVQLVQELYQSALAADELKPELAWQQLGPLDRWVKEGLTAEEIARRPSDHAAGVLASWLMLPVDVILGRQFPHEERLEAWLAGFIAQAEPFLRYDETALLEETRSQVRRDVWLLAPGGDASPLARVCQRWPQSPAWLQSQSADELVAIVIRRGLTLDV